MMSGKVLRHPASGPGLLIVEGQQYSFLPGPVWKSEVPPRPGLLVDLEFDAHGTITAITTVSEPQPDRQQSVSVGNHTPNPLSPSFVLTGITRTHLSAATALLLSWSFLTAVSVQVPLLGELNFSFWQLLTRLNSGSMLSVWERPDDPGTGFYGLLAILAFTGPFLPFLWKDRRAPLGAFFPLLFLSFVGFMLRRVVLLPPGAAAYPNLPQPPILKAVSFGSGAYLSTLVSLYFAVSSTKQLLKRPARITGPFEQSHNAAA